MFIKSQLIDDRHSSFGFIDEIRKKHTFLFVFANRNRFAQRKRNVQIMASFVENAKKTEQKYTTELKKQQQTQTIPYNSQ